MKRILAAVIVLSALLVAACAGTPSSGTTTTTTGSGSGSSGAGLFARLPGLWSGEAGSTPLGSFPLMAMDFQAADSSWLFGRVDLDATDNLRFGFAYENLDGGATLVYRNGGFFGALLRDTSTELVDSDEDAGMYHFCAEQSGCWFSLDGGCLPLAGGCGFVDAVFTFSSPTQLVLNAHVMGAEHLIWTATREETRTTPTGFPASAPLLEDAGWPDLPQAQVTVSWTQALANATDVWVILSDTPCAQAGSTTFTCAPSRSLTTTAAAGATSATLLFDEILPGTYYSVALLDLAGGFATTQMPEPGDGLSDPSASFTVPSTGQVTATAPIVFTVP